jgi:putative transposase
MEQGYRESTESWAGVLRSLKERGMQEAPLLVVGDGNLGLWAALNEVFPEARQQRCWNYKALNIIDKLPKRLQPQARRRLREISQAPTRQECTRLGDVYRDELRAIGQGSAADCLERDWEELTAFYDFPQEHWLHLRTSNPIESIFAGVRLRTNAAKRMRVRENTLYLVFKLICRLSLNWRAINAPNQLTLLLTGHRYLDGKLIIGDAAAAEQQAVGA